MSQSIVYIAMSLDGFIADKNDSISFLDKFQIPGEDYGYNKFIESIGTIIMGSNTYKKVLSFTDWPYEWPVYVLTKKPQHSPNPLIKFYSGDLSELLVKIKFESSKNIYVDGGKTIQSFLKEGLVDKVIVSIVPMLLGSGVSLFHHLGTEIELSHLETKTFDSGLVQVSYLVKK